MVAESTRKEILITASKTGYFLDAVYKSYLAEGEEREDLALDVAALHNEGHVDVVAEFEKLDKDVPGSPDFFMTRHIFEKAIPHIDASVSAVMQSVLHLNRSAGQDHAAGTIFDGYIGFCKKAPVRLQEALKLIEAHPGLFADMLPATIAAGSSVDNPRYLREVVRLCQHPDIILRQRSVFALSRVQWSNEANVPEFAISALEKSATEDDTEILSSVIWTAFTFYQQDKSTESRVTSLIGAVLSKRDKNILHAASMLFGFHTKEIPPPLLDLLLDQLKRVKPTNRSTLDRIDDGLAHLLKGHYAEKGLRFLEEFLLMHSLTLTIKVFDSTAREVRKNNVMLSKVITRWFLNGARVLCEGVYEIGGTHHGANLMIEIDPAELIPMDPVRIVFVAHKAIGYFFLKPVTAASIMISLMRHAPDGETLEQLSQLLFDPLLLNYPGSVAEYVEAQATRETGKVKEALDKALAWTSRYLEVLRTVPVLPALHPSQAHRESHLRYMSESTEASLEAAEKKSVFFGLFAKQTLLYGRKSIDYIHAGDGEPRRMETPLVNHSVKMEIPRMGHLDEYGLNFMLRVFRAERIRS